MAVSEIALRHPPLFHPAPDAFYLSLHGDWQDMVPYVCSVALAIAIAAYFFWRGKEVDGRIQQACLTAASLLCFKHQIYDFLLLAFCLAIALKAQPGRTRNLLLLAIGYFWYVERLLHIRRWEFWPAVVIFSFVLLWTLIYMAWKLHGTIQWKGTWTL